MKKPTIAATAILLSACATAQAAPEMVAIPGVENQETVIRSGVVEEYHRGQGDAMYVRDRENKWYRLGLNDGCIRDGFLGESAVFQTNDPSGRIDYLSKIYFSDSGRYCTINSIRRSVAPPQVDSDSPIPVD